MWSPRRESPICIKPTAARRGARPSLPSPAPRASGWVPAPRALQRFAGAASLRIRKTWASRRWRHGVRCWPHAASRTWSPGPAGSINRRRDFAAGDAMSANPCELFTFDRHAGSVRDPRHALQLADLAVEVLAAEALLTPKPALVDGRGPGAHRDLDLPAMLKSANSLHGTFLNMAVAAAGREPDQALREQLARIGRAGERCMFAATGGSNAHRGAIWVLGLLVAARAIQGESSPPGADLGGEAGPRETAALAARIAAIPDRHAPARDSHGARVCRRYGVGGARGEAAAGFPHVVEVGLPAMWAAG